MLGYLRRVLITLDQAFNVIFLGGEPDETASSHWGRRRKLKKLEATIACSILDALDPGHCEGSIEATPSGEIESHHSGEVIHELKPGHPRLTKVPLLLAAMAVLLIGCASTPPDPLFRALTKCPPCKSDEACREGDGRPAACVPYVRPLPPDCRDTGCPPEAICMDVIPEGTQEVQHQCRPRWGGPSHVSRFSEGVIEWQIEP